MKASLLTPAEVRDRSTFRGEITNTDSHLLYLTVVSPDRHLHFGARAAELEHRNGRTPTNSSELDGSSNEKIHA